MWPHRKWGEMDGVGEGSRQPLFPLFAHLLGPVYFPENFPGKSWLHVVWLGYKAIFRETQNS